VRLEARESERGEGTIEGFWLCRGVEGVHLGAGEGLWEDEAVSKNEDVRGLLSPVVMLRRTLRWDDSRKMRGDGERIDGEI
jgi:hypothetical protein